jgi:agmatine/peptidylarginine deiminase
MRDLRAALKHGQVEIRELAGTADIWVRDYFPIQRHDGKFVSFTYDPDYLRKGYRHLITDWRKVTPLPEKMRVIDCGLVLDGGNVVLQGQSAIVTKKVFTENPQLSHAQVEDRLRNAFELDTLIFIPNEEGDIWGHADGMLAWAGPGHVLMNDYRRIDQKFRREVKRILIRSNINVTEIPYAPDMRPRKIPSAEGTYANLLVLPEIVLVPKYGIPSDQDAAARIAAEFSDRQVVPVDSTSLARKGGAIHCVTSENRLVPARTRILPAR